MTTVLTICALFALVSLMHTLALLLAGRYCGATVEEFVLFLGPGLCRFQVAGVRVTIRCLPIGGYVKFYDATNEEDKTDAEVTFPLDTLPPRPFHALHPCLRGAVILSGCATLLLVAAICLGPSEAWTAFLRGFSQFPAAAVAPISTGKELVARLADVATHLPFDTALGLLCAKAAALNLLPLPVLNGGAFLLTVIRWKRPAPARFEGITRVLGLVVLMLFAGSVLLAVLAYLYSVLV